MAGIYIHIPFCKQKCNYCNFHFSTQLTSKEACINAMAREIKLRKAYLEGETIETIYFGGGTPSILTPDDFNVIMKALQQEFGAQLNVKEFTIEANPDDINIDLLKYFKKIGVNRFSLGIQSFKASDLAYMNRAHDIKQSHLAIQLCQEQAFENLSIDLIYGTPGLTNEEWEQNIQIAIDYKIPHISAYALTVEEKTTLAHQIQTGKSQPVNELQAAQQFEILINTLTEAGYHHYEISNFALPNRYALHNTNYWRGTKYLGIGPSAHSYNVSARQWNIANNQLYINSILNQNTLPLEEETLSATDQYNEYIMTSLRTMWGISKHILHTKFAAYLQHFDTQIQDPIQKEHLTLQSDHYILTTKGKQFADAIASDLFY